MGVPRSWPVVFVTSLALALIPVIAGPPDAPGASGLNLHRNLPKDPLLVLAVTVEDPEREIEALLELAGEFGAGEFGQSVSDGLERLDASLGFSLQRDLLPLLGPQITVSFDLPPIDYSLLALQSGTPEAFTAVMGRIGIVAEVRDPGKLEANLLELLEVVPGEIDTEDGLVGIRIPIWINEADAAEDDALDSSVKLQYLIVGDRIAIGFSPHWVRTVLHTQPEGEGLGAGEDFARVFAQLDDRATRLSYVNLPKIRNLVVESHILTTVLEGNVQTRDLLRLVSAPDVMEVGLGSTSLAMNGGIRTINFGPNWLSGAIVTGGLVAAAAVPAMLLADDDDKTRATAEQIESIAEACEGFSTDTKTYPPAEGWVPVERIALFLEPLYAHVLPKIDAWENPILYWSDGTSYRILSTGEDGVMDHDWSRIDTPGLPVESGEDIAFGDGRFLVAP